MQTFFISLQSEFLKTRKTLSFWIAILLPLLICGLVFTGFYSNSEKMLSFSGTRIWMQYMGAIMNVMGILLLPMFVIFITYSVNSIEHRSDTWKSLFSMPIPKWTIYSSKYVYVVLLDALCLSLFASLILITGNLMELLKPDLKFDEYSIVSLAFQVHTKLFLASLGILSIQFLLSLLWADFLKPMGIGFVAMIAGIICSQTGWKYAYTIPYAHPMLALMSMKPSKAALVNVDMFSKEIIVSLIVAAVAFVLGYFVVAKRSVK